MSAQVQPAASREGGAAKPPRHFLELADFDAATLRHMLALAADAKAGRVPEKPLAGKSVALIFEKPSTRTRVSFEVGIQKLGGHAVVLSARDMQLGRGESVADTARVLSRYVDAIMLRTDSVAKLRGLAEHATVPVINGLTDVSHPCQLMADILTFEEHRGPVAGKVFAWTGDGNNVAQSFIQAAARFDFTLRLATPPELAPPAQLVDWARREGARVELTSDPVEAVRGADCVVTDTWVSMSDEKEDGPSARHNMLAPYQLNAALLRHAKPEAIVLHCLPAHRGEEITEEVIEGPQSVVFDEAENRLHAQNGVLLWALAGL
ncbi:ornithine carbamoyltransferase [Pseudoroseomonas cervicalis]|uniref:Ornithine carbamoyltransferase n=1 Tax=Pseudoroseomonas cervicalis ATCC 49957 TaxID=525371 RepID=D5RT63_9PROT|nr:ornithine carbamoyltransferase [Pseudoroseomonas cervicalis]EFH09505.1 ornithine carbamoyltransferase [Pseudoroseomonas cervicalis ATCC 49957]